jgi:hypothetical protein
MRVDTATSRKAEIAIVNEDQTHDGTLVWGQSERDPLRVAAIAAVTESQARARRLHAQAKSPCAQPDDQRRSRRQRVRQRRVADVRILALAAARRTMGACWRE